MITRGIKILLLSLTLALCPFPQVAAIDPVTMAVLAPVALKGAQVAAPYAIRGLQSGGTQLLCVGQDMIEMFYLPLGVLQCTAGAPFGLIGNGFQNITQGVVAPFKLAVDLLILPISFFGLTPG